ncbi:hypothetical protein DUK53_07060 [Listeria sp. SHR_NRA_18]|uniref:murein biosynthesis integral membrane protein MurJ n=1 Tax=Listeria sp. SHR_NRA_18 TaxID=2269046 RepID=UPI00051D56AA|nr:lipid II flippase MurJ [Listeria sp. SHR_NRA_18]KGL41149.1 hypothetical protein EP56_11120 [Listeriaceae bacterium FSL A5-0209]RQW67502.1 hypothetical protein DUK53_07060 [Listeria sp. SHR_NRA_18]
MTLLTISIQFVGLVKNIFIAKGFGVSTEVDAYNLANTYTVSITNLAIPAITVVLIPFLTRRTNELVIQSALNTYISTLLLSISLLVLFGSGGTLFLLQSDVLLSETMQWTLLIIMILSIAQIFRVLTAILTAFLQVDNDFVTPKVAILCSTIFSATYVVMASNPSIIGVSFFLTASFLLECIFLIIKNKGVSFRFQLQWKNNAFRKLMRQTGPVVFNSIVFQISLIFSITLAGFLGQGYVATLGYANQIVSIIQAVIIVNILTLVYPTMSRAFNKQIKIGKQLFINYVTVANMLVIPLVVGMIIVGDLLTALLFQRGAFTAEDTAQVTFFMMIISIGLPGLVLRDFVYRVYFCLEDTRTPSRISLVTIGINIILLLVLTPFFGIYAVILIPSVMNIVSGLVVYRLLEKRVGKIDPKHTLLKQHIITLVNAVVMGIVLYLLRMQWRMESSAAFFILVIVGIIVYGLLVCITQRSILRQLKNKGVSES